MYFTNLFQQYTGGGADSLVTAIIAIAMTLIIVYSFKIFVLKSQESFQKKFEKDGYRFSIEWEFPEGIIKVDPSKEVLWVSTHGNKLILIKDIEEMLLVKGTFELISIYIRTKSGEVFKYPVASSRKKSKRMSTSLMDEITNKFEDIKKYVLEGIGPELAIYPFGEENILPPAEFCQPEQTTPETVDHKVPQSSAEDTTEENKDQVLEFFKRKDNYIQCFPERKKED